MSSQGPHRREAGEWDSETRWEDGQQRGDVFEDGDGPLQKLEKAGNRCPWSPPGPAVQTPWFQPRESTLGF